MSLPPSSTAPDSTTACHPFAATQSTQVVPASGATSAARSSTYPASTDWSEEGPEWSLRLASLLPPDKNTWLCLESGIETMENQLFRLDYSLGAHGRTNGIDPGYHWAALISWSRSIDAEVFDAFGPACWKVTALHHCGRQSVRISVHQLLPNGQDFDRFALTPPFSNPRVHGTTLIQAFNLSPPGCSSIAKRMQDSIETVADRFSNPATVRSLGLEAWLTKCMKRNHNRRGPPEYVPANIPALSTELVKMICTSLRSELSKGWKNWESQMLDNGYEARCTCPAS